MQKIPRDAVASPVLLLVLAAIGSCSIRELEFHLGYYSPGPTTLLEILIALARAGDVRVIKRAEYVNGHPCLVPVFSLPQTHPRSEPERTDQ